MQPDSAFFLQMNSCLCDVKIKIAFKLNFVLENEELYYILRHSFGKCPSLFVGRYTEG